MTVAFYFVFFDSKLSGVSKGAQKCSALQIDDGKENKFGKKSSRKNLATLWKDIFPHALVKTSLILCIVNTSMTIKVLQKRSINEKIVHLEPK